MLRSALGLVLCVVCEAPKGYVVPLTTKAAAFLMGHLE